jgi:hypothetical protein
MKGKLLIFLSLFLVLVPVTGSSQDTLSVLDRQSMELMNLKLPPLEELFEGARKSSMVEFYEYRMEGEQLTLKTEKRKWLSFFSAYASYQYGVMGINSYQNLGEEIPIMYQYSSSDQLWYNAGVSFRFNLEQLFDRKNRIRRQQLMINETRMEREMWYDEQRMEIIDFYTKIEELFLSMEYTLEMYSIAKSQFQDAKKDYVLGNITGQAFTIAKSYEVNSRKDLQKIMSELKANILKLEIITNIKILR